MDKLLVRFRLLHEISLGNPCTVNERIKIVEDSDVNYVILELGIVKAFLHRDSESPLSEGQACRQNLKISLGSDSHRIACIHAIKPSLRGVGPRTCVNERIDAQVAVSVPLDFPQE